jgi:CRP-like cAMP-binding protein
LQEKFSYLNCLPLFKEWQRSGKFVLLHNLEERSFSTNSIIYKRATIGTHVYFIVKGEVQLHTWRLLNHSDETLNTILAHTREEQYSLGVFDRGQMFGDYELDPLNAKSSVVYRSQAITRVETVVFSISIPQLLDSFRLFGSL